MINKLLLLTLLMFFSCGTRKTDKLKVSIKSDSVVKQVTTEFVLNTHSLERLTINPYDKSKPIILNGKHYYNASITFDKNNTVNVSVKDEVKDVKFKKDIIETTKETNRTNNSFTYLGLFFILCSFVFLWFYLKRRKQQ